MRGRIALLALAAVVGLVMPTAAQTSRSITLLPQTTIAAARAGVIQDVAKIPLGTRNLSVQAVFLYGAGGTTAKAWVQTSLDGGTTWIDVMAFAFTTAAATKVTAVRGDVAIAAAYTPTDATLADDTLKDGLLGDRIRVKWTTTGTYSGATSLTVTAVIQ